MFNFVYVYMVTNLLIHTHTHTPPTPYFPDDKLGNNSRPVKKRQSEPVTGPVWPRGWVEV